MVRSQEEVKEEIEKSYTEVSDWFKETYPTGKVITEVYYNVEEQATKGVVILLDAWYVGHVVTEKLRTTHPDWLDEVFNQLVPSLKRVIADKMEALWEEHT